MSKIAPSRKSESSTVYELVISLLESIIEQEEKSDIDLLNDSFSSNTDLNLTEDCITLQQWEKHESEKQTFDALSTKEMKLERIFVVIRLLLQILETDLGMWILRNHKDPSYWLFCKEEQPLIVTLFNLTNYTMLTPSVKKLVNLFAVCVKKELKSEYLAHLEVSFIFW